VATTKPIWFEKKKVKEILEGRHSRLDPDEILIARKRDFSKVKQTLMEAYALSDGATRAIASTFAYITVPRPTPPGPPTKKWLREEITVPGYKPMSTIRR